MTRIIAGLFLLAVIAVIVAAFIVPNKSKISVIVPELQNAANRTGYIKGLTEENGMTTVAFDVIQLYVGNQAREESDQDQVELIGNVYIRDLNANLEMLILDPKVNISINSSGQTTNVNIDEFQTAFLAEPERYTKIPFEIQFNQSGLVNKISEINRD